MSSLTSKFKQAFSEVKQELANMPEETFELLLESSEYENVTDVLKYIRLSQKAPKKQEPVREKRRHKGHPLRNFSLKFVQLMKNRVATSSFKYGDLITFKKDPTKFRDEMKNARYRMSLYDNTANMEYLVDAANFLMFEFMEMNGYFLGTDDDPNSKVLGEV